MQQIVAHFWHQFKNTGFIIILNENRFQLKNIEICLFLIILLKIYKKNQTYKYNEIIGHSKKSSKFFKEKPKLGYYYYY